MWTAAPHSCFKSSVPTSRRNVDRCTLRSGHTGVSRNGTERWRGQVIRIPDVCPIQTRRSCLSACQHQNLKMCMRAGVMHTQEYAPENARLAHFQVLTCGPSRNPATAANGVPASCGADNTWCVLSAGHLRSRPHIRAGGSGALEACHNLACSWACTQAVIDRDPAGFCYPIPRETEYGRTVFHTL